MKNYGTLMKLWGWVQDNVSDSDMKARIAGVQIPQISDGN